MYLTHDAKDRSGMVRALLENSHHIALAIEYVLDTFKRPFQIQHVLYVLLLNEATLNRKIKPLIGKTTSSS